MNQHSEFTPIEFGAQTKPFPSRGDNFETIGKLEAEVGLGQRQARSFKTHADWMNYLYGRKQGEQ